MSKQISYTMGPGVVTVKLVEDLTNKVLSLSAVNNVSKCLSRSVSGLP